MSLSTEVYVSIGSIFGYRLLNLKSAGSALKNISKSVEFSDVYISTARGFITQPEFFNAASKLTTILSPWNFLDQIRTIEKNHGRYRIFPNAPRSIDIDLGVTGNEYQISIYGLTLSEGPQSVSIKLLHHNCTGTLPPTVTG